MSTDFDFPFLISFRFKTLSIDFTHYNRESGLFVCVSVKLEWAQAQRVTPFLSIHPLLVPSSSSGLDLRVALSVTLTTYFQIQRKKTRNEEQYIFSRKSFKHHFDVKIPTTVFRRFSFSSLLSSCCPGSCGPWLLSMLSICMIADTGSSFSWPRCHWRRPSCSSASCLSSLCAYPRYCKRPKQLTFWIH